MTRTSPCAHFGSHRGCACSTITGGLYSPWWWIFWLGVTESFFETEWIDLKSGSPSSGGSPSADSWTSWEDAVGHWAADQEAKTSSSSSSPSSPLSSSFSEGYPGNEKELRSWTRRWMVVGLSWSVASLFYLCVVFGGIKWNYAGFQQAEQHLVVPNDKMVAAWDRRYYRQTVNTGLEVVVLKRTRTAVVWVVAMPDMSFKEIEIPHRPTVQSQADSSLFWVPMAVLSQQKKEDLMSRATAIVNGTAARIERMPRFQQASGHRGKRLMGVFISLLVIGAKWVHWGLRSRTRFLGMIGFVFLVYELMEGTGIFEKIRMATESQAFWEEPVMNVTQASSAAEVIYDFVKMIYATVSGYVNPGKAFTYLLGLLAAYHAVSEADREEECISPSSRVGSSPISTPPRRPRAEDDVVAGAIRTMSSAIDQQQQVLTKLILEQNRLAQVMQDEADERKAGELRRRMEQQDQGPPPANLLEEMTKRLAHFQNIFEKDRAGPSTSRPSLGGGEVRPEVGGGAGLERVEEVKTGHMTAGEGSSEMGDVIRKLKQKAMKPQEIYMGALGDYRPVDPEAWAVHFPPWYRERLAPAWLGEVYPSGMTLKEWGKQWLKEKKADDSKDAREVLPARVGLDSIFLRDQTKDAINFVSVGRLARKAYGIVVGYENVRIENDWKRNPANKGWKSKVDHEL